ncbi:MAG: dTDP-4-amino-4,6-dideoxygalactose transaminase [Acetobacteraceae bacterium]|nr:dTDP-4-amino-4,6-dideoxygalactose transaminase [Acetobacteraceae bacterium]
MRIGFNRPALAGNELEYIREALAKAHTAGDGSFTRRCNVFLENLLGAPKALLTHSCTAALEMAAILFDLGPGDEVIMPSFTFVSTANAVVLRGAVPVFVDIRPDTLNIDEGLIENAITPRTKAIFVVHYAGVGCEMNGIMAIADRHGLLVAEDAAQGLMSRYRGRPLGGIGHLAAISFHETKNIISGEGGALIVNDARFAARAEIIREKGTNRGSFFRGEVDKYTWVDIGSSYLPSDMIAAFLLAQFEHSERLLAERRELWGRYHAGFAELEGRELCRRPIVPAGCDHNAHLYYLVLPLAETRDSLIAALRADGIQAPFHYVPLHSSPAGLRYGRTSGSLKNTENLARRLVRLPLWYGMTAEPDRVLDRVHALLER